MSGETSIANRLRSSTAPAVEVPVEVPVLSREALVALERAAATVAGTDGRVLDALTAVQARLEEAQAERAELRTVISALVDQVTGATRHGPTAPSSRGGGAPEAQAPVARESQAGQAPATGTRTASSPSDRSEHPGEGRMPKAERLILTALAQHPGSTAVQVAILTNYSHKSGGFRNALSALRSKGLIAGTGPNGMAATAAGLEALGPYEALPSGEALRQWWKERHLGKAERGILDVIAAAYPHGVPVEEIAGRTGYSATSGGFRNALSRLRSLQLAYNSEPKVLAMSASLAD